jgi:tetratricopeptide (TPR) repeat protein
MSGADDDTTPATSDELYELYKDALKRGHVASLRGQMDEALLCYAEAARIAPERSTPHSSAGTALLRRKRPLDALRHYEVALGMSPRDEAALLGRAQALAALERRGEAADAYDALADLQASVGRLADAVDAARRGLEMAEGRERRRTLERLIAKLRASEPDEPGRLALDLALQVLDGSAVPAQKPVPVDDSASAAPVHAAGTPAAPQAPVPPVAAASAPSGPAPAAATRGAASGVTAAAPAPSAGAATGQAGRAPEASPVLHAFAMPAVPEAIPADAVLADYIARAEAAVIAGVPGPAVDALLDLSALHVRDGRIEAALDACYTALSFDPDSVALHLALAQLYGGRGWTPLADEKLRLLERLARLDGDRVAIAAIAGVRADLD